MFSSKIIAVIIVSIYYFCDHISDIAFLMSFEVSLSQKLYFLSVGIQRRYSSIDFGRWMTRRLVCSESSENPALNCPPLGCNKDHLLLIQCYYRRKPKLN